MLKDANKSYNDHFSEIWILIKYKGLKINKKIQNQVKIIIPKNYNIEEF